MNTELKRILKDMDSLLNQIDTINFENNNPDTDEYKELEDVYKQLRKACECLEEYNNVFIA